MKNFLFISSILLTLFSCQEDITEWAVYEGPCSIPATVIDMTGLDGCGYMIQLENGDLLEPIWRWGLFCGTPPLPLEITEDPLYNFEFVDGMHVMIDYDVTKIENGMLVIGDSSREFYGSICMVGTPVIITCIVETDKPTSNF